MNYSFDDENINELRVGDTLTIEDGTKHIAIKDTFFNPPCRDNCSIYQVSNKLSGRCQTSGVLCSFNDFHFNKV